MNRKSRTNVRRGLIITGIIAFILAITISCSAVRTSVNNSESREPIVGTVVDKYTKRIDSVDKFFVVIEDENGETHVLENTDSFFAGKYDSADFQAKLKEGKKYEVMTFGMRSAVMSMYPNVTSIKAL
ncbi:DUF1523 family protein [Bacillus mycoides]|uniref:Phi77 ORF031-like protein n=1 Tax=Bacillus mycoides (strain KBAB4) TaxID=315730 RepID=A9VVN4_BACMK|nr:DUF1523 family protein [Bacillus mycoides]ABY46849.1 phi77 ORF031-like protein [Bacillus mycoides KBAB4]